MSFGYFCPFSNFLFCDIFIFKKAQRQMVSMTNVTSIKMLDMGVTSFLDVTKTLQTKFLSVNNCKNKCPNIFIGFYQDTDRLIYTFTHLDFETHKRRNLSSTSSRDKRDTTI